MNILLIGNGFDLAHKLPTQYEDFLDFCKNVKGFYSNIKEGKEESPLDKFEIDVLSELLSLVESNFWLEYFWDCPAYIGENWIDLESQISRVIRIIDELRNKPMQKEVSLDDKDEYSMGIINAFRKSRIWRGVTFRNIKEVDRLIATLENDLKKLIRTFEIYLTEFVGKIKNDVMVPEIEKLDVDCVLSFNYTDTFEYKYGTDKKIDYNYVHGKAKLSNTIESNNMVLGIDEYLPEDRKNKEFEFLSFKKFYQRLLKSTDNNYLDWIDEIKDEYEKYVKLQNDVKELFWNELTSSAPQIPLSIQKHNFNEKIKTDYPKHTLYIFGHSLDATDKDILKLFICNDNVQTKIFYYRRYEDDKSVLGKLITNLIGIIGQDELLRRTGGKHKTIEFIPQSIVEENV